MSENREYSARPVRHLHVKTFSFRKLFDRHATHIQVDLKGFLASGTLFFRPPSGRASYEVASNKFQLFYFKSRNQHQHVARLGDLGNIFSRWRSSLSRRLGAERSKLEHILDFVLLYAVTLLFPSLLTQYLFSACAIQPDLHVIRSCCQ